MTFLSSVRMLRSAGLLDAKTSALLDDLRVVGNKAAHSDTKTIAKEETIRLGRITDGIIKYLYVLS
jgi:hypothetical protein